MKTQNNSFKTWASTILLCLSLTACADDCAFSNLTIGSSKQEAVAIMGDPAASEMVMLPLGVQAERLTWENWPKSKVYKADFVFNKVLDKRIESKRFFN